MERRLFRHVVRAVQQLRRAGPADFDAAEQIGLRARHLEDALGLEVRLGAENLRVGPEAHLGAAPVRRLAGFLQFALRLAALEGHAVELLPARDLDLHAFGQRVDDRDADAVQAAGGLVDLGVEFAAGVQRAHDHFERRLVLEFRMRIDRNAAAVVGDGDKAVRRHLDLDPVGVAGERLVHGIVDHLGEQVMQRLLVGAADIHAGPAAHRLEPFQNLDVARGIGRLRRRAAQGAPPARRPPPRRVPGALANRSGVSDVFGVFAVFPTAVSMWRLDRRRTTGDESASDYATCPAKHERAGNANKSWPATQIDACPPRPYIAAHDKVFRDQCWRSSSSPSLSRYGTSARSRVKARAAGAAAPPSPKNLPADAGFVLQAPTIVSRVERCLRKKKRPKSACSAPPAIPARNWCGCFSAIRA